MTADSKKWFVQSPPRLPPKLRLICCPHAGGSPTAFAPWAARLPPALELLTLQLPGHGSRLREPPFTRLTELVEAVGPALLPSLDGPPYALLGHSMGTLVAFELARWLRRRGAPLPTHLVVAARRAPHIRYGQGDVHRRSVDGLIQQLRQLGGTPQEILAHREVLELFVPIIRADYEVAETYRYTEEPPLPCPILALAGLEDPETLQEDLALWGKHTTGGFTMKHFPGGHFFLHQQPEVLATLLAALGE